MGSPRIGGQSFQLSHVKVVLSTRVLYCACPTADIAPLKSENQRWLSMGSIAQKRKLELLGTLAYSLNA